MVSVFLLSCGKNKYDGLYKQRSQIIFGEGNIPSVTILIPILGNRDIHETIESVIAQNYPVYEIFILHNGIQELPDGREIAEKDEYNKMILNQLQFATQRYHTASED